MISQWTFDFHNLSLKRSISRTENEAYNGLTIACGTESIIEASG